VFGSSYTRERLLVGTRTAIVAAVCSCPRGHSWA